MKRILYLMFTVILVLSLASCSSNTDKNNNDGKDQANQIQSEITSTVEGFGSALKQVSLLAPEESLKEDITQYYSPFVTSSLLEKWMGDPSIAPGRETSSPWPDRIKVDTITKLDSERYEVTGLIIEITSEEVRTDAIAAERNITLTVVKTEKGWRINDIKLGDYNAKEGISYKNTEYGFMINLPADWQNYSIVNDQWKGIAINGVNSGSQVESGPIISVRNPQWTAEIKWQDIPIMVFTQDQWNLLEKEEFSVGAAPMLPSKLGSNDNYVFALPARYNFEFLEGFEEVENIVKNLSNFSTF